MNTYRNPPAKSGRNEEMMRAILEITIIIFQNFSCFLKKFIQITEKRAATVLPQLS